MANTKSALKAARVSARKRIQNKPVMSAVRTYLGKANKAVTGKDTSSAPAAVLQAVKTLDKAARKGAIHPNNAARRKSRLMKKLNALPTA